MIIFFPTPQTFLLGWMKILIRVHYYNLVSNLIQTNN